MRKRVLETLKSGLLDCFVRVFGDGARQVTCPEFVKPKLVVRGHEKFCQATGWPIPRYAWETIRLKIRVPVAVLQRDPVQHGVGRPVGPKEFMTIDVPGLGMQARYVAGLEEFHLAFGMKFPGKRPDQKMWNDMWRRTGETSMLLYLDPSEVNHGQKIRV